MPMQITMCRTAIVVQQCSCASHGLTFLATAIVLVTWQQSKLEGQDTDLLGRGPAPLSRLGNREQLLSDITSFTSQQQCQDHGEVVSQGSYTPIPLCSVLSVSTAALVFMQVSLV